MDADDRYRFVTLASTAARSGVRGRQWMTVVGVIVVALATGCSSDGDDAQASGTASTASTASTTMSTTSAPTSVVVPPTVVETTVTPPTTLPPTTLPPTTQDPGPRRCDDVNTEDGPTPITIDDGPVDCAEATRGLGAIISPSSDTIGDAVGNYQTGWDVYGWRC